MHAGAGSGRAELSPGRQCAFAVLRRVFEQGAYADRALHGQAAGLDGRNRAQAMRLAYGAVQRRGTLDHWIEALAERPLSRLDGTVLAALRLGLYELMYSSGAPEHAVVSQAVALAGGAVRSDRSRAQAGIVNALLRRAVAEREQLLGALDDSTAAGAAVAHSQPQWLVQLWWGQLGQQRTRALLESLNQPAEVALRLNTLRADLRTARRALPVRVRADALLAEALIAEEPLDLTASRAWREGMVIAQSRAAMLAAHVLEPQPGEQVLDLCAAPGGKTTHIAALMQGRGEVLAIESNRSRAQRLARTLRRMAAGNVTLAIADARMGPVGGRQFDRVLVDPPCSGLGTLQRRPDLRWHLSEQSIPELVQTQAKILHAGAQALRPGGRLVYSTCTISVAENEGQIERFLQTHADFKLEDISQRWPQFRARQDDRADAAQLAKGGIGQGDVEEDADEQRDETISSRTLQTLPDRDRTAGFFYAALRREGQ